MHNHNGRADGAEPGVLGTGRIKELSAVAGAYAARNVVEDEVICLGAAGACGDPGDLSSMGSNVRFDAATMNDRDRRGIREVATVARGGTTLRVERRLMPAYDGEEGIVLSQVAVTNMGGTSYEGKLTVGLLLKDRYRLDGAVPGDDYGATAHYAHAVAGGDHPGDARYRLLLGKTSGVSGADCSEPSQMYAESVHADAAGVAATFDVDLGAYSTRRYTVSYFAPLAEDADYNAVYWQRGPYYRDFTCEAVWHASYTHSWCDLDAVCEAFETAASCPADCVAGGRDAAPAGFLATAGDGVCGEGERVGNATDFRDAKDCGCGPGYFYGKVGSTSGCYPGNEWSVYSVSDAKEARQPGAAWAQPEFVEWQGGSEIGSGDWTNGIVDVKYRVPYSDDGCSADKERAEECFLVFRRWFWMPEDSGKLTVSIGSNNFDGVYLNGHDISALEGIVGRTDVRTFDLSGYVEGTGAGDGKPDYVRKGEYNLLVARVNHGSARLLSDARLCAGDCVYYSTGPGGLFWEYGLDLQGPNKQGESSSGPGTIHLRLDHDGDGEFTKDEVDLMGGGAEVVKFVPNLNIVDEVYMSQQVISWSKEVSSCFMEPRKATFLGMTENGPVKATFKFRLDLAKCGDEPFQYLGSGPTTPVNAYFSFRRDMPNCYEFWLERQAHPGDYATFQFNSYMINAGDGMSATAPRKVADNEGLCAGHVSCQSKGEFIYPFFTGYTAATKDKHGDLITSYLFNLNKRNKAAGGIDSIEALEEDSSRGHPFLFGYEVSGNWKNVPHGSGEAEHALVCFFSTGSAIKTMGEVQRLIDWNGLQVVDGTSCCTNPPLSGNEVECSCPPSSLGLSRHGQDVLVTVKGVGALLAVSPPALSPLQFVRYKEGGQTREMMSFVYNDGGASSVSVAPVAGGAAVWWDATAGDPSEWAFSAESGGAKLATIAPYNIFFPYWKANGPYVCDVSNGIGRYTFWKGSTDVAGVTVASSNAISIGEWADGNVMWNAQASNALYDTSTKRLPEKETGDGKGEWEMTSSRLTLKNYLPREGRTYLLDLDSPSTGDDKTDMDEMDVLPKTEPGTYRKWVYVPEGAEEFRFTVAADYYQDLQVNGKDVEDIVTCTWPYKGDMGCVPDSGYSLWEGENVRNRCRLPVYYSVFGNADTKQYDEARCSLDESVDFNTGGLNLVTVDVAANGDGKTFLDMDVRDYASSMHYRKAVTINNINEAQHDNYVQQRGGFTAEAAWVKQVTFLNAVQSNERMVSDNWDGPGDVLYRVLPSKEFMKQSLQRVVDSYTSSQYASFVLGPGNLGVPYLAAATRSALLPTQFLLVTEDWDKMKLAVMGAIEDGYKFYVTMGYDPTDPTYYFAWFKLLDVPNEYRQFISDKAETGTDVFIMGNPEEGMIPNRLFKAVSYCDASDCQKGSMGARAIYESGYIYVMENVCDKGTELTLLPKLDQDEFTVGGSAFTCPEDSNDPGRFANSVKIIDWEDGISDVQFSELMGSIKNANIQAIENIITIKAEGTSLQKIGGLTMAKLYEKNKAMLPELMQCDLDAPSKGNNCIRFAINGYPVFHPYFEFFERRLPVTFAAGPSDTLMKAYHEKVWNVLYEDQLKGPDNEIDLLVNWQPTSSGEHLEAIKQVLEETYIEACDDAEKDGDGECPQLGINLKVYVPHNKDAGISEEDCDDVYSSISDELKQKYGDQAIQLIKRINKFTVKCYGLDDNEKLYGGGETGEWGDGEMSMVDDISEILNSYTTTAPSQEEGFAFLSWGEAHFDAGVINSCLDEKDKITCDVSDHPAICE